MKKIFVNPEINSVELLQKEVIMASGDPLANENNVKYVTDDKEWSDDSGNLWDAHGWF